jgi:hypothetical protein
MSETQNGTWVILESMGHGRVAGRYYVENGLHRVDIPDPTDPEHYRTEWYGNAAIFRITPVDELTARKVAAQSVIPEAIPFDVRYQLKQLAAPKETLEMLEDLEPDGQGAALDEGEDEFEPDVAYDDLP